MQNNNLQEYIGNPANYKPVNIKMYNLWCSLPSIGTQWCSKVYDVRYTITPTHRVLLSGATGVIFCITIAELCTQYNHTDGTLITLDWLNKQLSYKGYIDWFLVKPREDKFTVRHWCLHIPKKNKFVLNCNGRNIKVNKPYVQHGLGDFIIRGDFNYQPNMFTFDVINGIDFVNMFQVRGLENYVVSAEERKKVRVLRPKSVY